ncbi:hypothetical protein IWX90DRAFT_434729, partial [Phyllosticta citrichinensis]
LGLGLGPCLDVLTNARNQPLGVRTTGDDPQEVSAYGVAFMRGYKEAGLVTMGKHFPSYGNLEFLGSALDVPIITESLEQLSLSALVPFLVEGLLRSDLKFEGVVVSVCLEMEALSHNIGVGGGTVMAVNAGCDIVLLCRSFSVQKEAIDGLKVGFENSAITIDRVRESLRRVLTMKSKCTSWEKALNPPGISILSTMQPSHTALSTKAYNKSITVVRDKNRFLPLSNIIESDEELLLLTPLVKPLPASAASYALSETVSAGSPEPAVWERKRVFRELGRSLARQRNGRVLHTSYTANGVRPVHENLITRASAIIILTADANRNLYQHGFTKHYTAGGERREKPLIVVAVSSPYDFAMDPSIGTYNFQSQKLHQSRQHWLVEIFNDERDANALDNLIKAITEKLASATLRIHLVAPSRSHRVALCRTIRVSTGTGVIGALFLSIGHSLHNRAIRTLLQREGIKRFQLGSRLPSIFLGIPTGHGAERKRLRAWFANIGWNTALSRPVCSMVARNLSTWMPPEGMAKSLGSAGVEFDLVYGWETSQAVLDHIKTSNRQGLAEVYKLALADPGACGVIRAKRSEDGALVGTVVLYNMDSSLAEFVPAMKDTGEMTGGISSPVISPA